MLPVPIPMAKGEYASEEKWGLIGGGEVDLENTGSGGNTGTCTHDEREGSESANKS